jgi:hypothetical protein
MMDLTNKRFGKLVALEHTRLNSRDAWRCICDCGEKVIVRWDHLVKENTKSCGCLHRRRGKDSPFFRGVGELPLDFYSKIRRSSVRYGRKLDFKVTPKYLWELFLDQNRKCALSGVPIEFAGTGAENKHSATNKITASLDRIDSSKGYVEGNVWWVHKTVNIMKNDMPTEDFQEWCRKIAECP